ncbi:MAG: SIMPL domain-containing protein [Sumerlaeia bacterium]
MSPTLPDTITVQISRKREVDAQCADLEVQVDSSAVFSGNAALQKAKELRALIEEMKRLGIEEKQVKLRRVALNSNTFSLIRTSSAMYHVSIKKVPMDLLSEALGTIAAQKGVELTHLEWRYGDLEAIERELRRDGLTAALAQAREDAAALGVALLGVHTLRADKLGGDASYHREYLSAAPAGAMRARSASPVDIGVELSNSTTVRIDLTVQFRVGPFEANSDGKPPS